MHRVQHWSGAFVCGFVAALVAWSAQVRAENWPQRPVRLIEPTSAGSGIDIPARLFAARLAERWKQPVVVENRPGADGIIGVNAFAGMHDDHALLYSPAAPISVFPETQENLPYDPTNVVPIASAVDTFVVVATSASLNVGTLSELATLARSQPGKLNYYAVGGGAFTPLFAGFVRSAGLDMVQVSYRDSALGMQDLAEGRIQVAIDTLAGLMPQLRLGKVRILAVTNKSRSAIVPEAPTAVEAGYPDLTFDGLQGFFGPRDIPAERRDRISADIRSVAADPAIADRLAALGQIARGSTPAEFSAAIDEQRSKIAAIVRLIGNSKR